MYALNFFSMRILLQRKTVCVRDIKLKIHENGISNFFRAQRRAVCVRCRGWVGPITALGKETNAFIAKYTKSSYKMVKLSFFGKKYYKQTKKSTFL